MLKDAVPVPLRQSQQRDSRRRRQRSQPALVAAAKPLSSEFDLRERLPYNTRSRSLGRAPHDRRPRLRARPARRYLAVNIPIDCGLIVGWPATPGACQKTGLDFRIAREGYSSTSNFASSAELGDAAA